jgi:hypothetical protein
MSVCVLSSDQSVLLSVPRWLQRFVYDVDQAAYANPPSPERVQITGNQALALLQRIEQEGRRACMPDFVRGA